MKMPSVQERIIKLMELYHSDDEDDKRKATDELVKMHERFVSKMIKISYPTYLKNYYEDLFQSGILGFLKSLPSYDPSKGALTTHSSRYIQHELSEYVSEQLSNMSLHYASTLRKLNKAIARLTAEGVKHIGIPLLALETGLNENRIAVALSVAKAASYVDDQQNLIIINYSDSQDMSPTAFVEKQEVSELVTNALTEYCTPIEAEIIKWKFKIAYFELSEREMAACLHVDTKTLRSHLQQGLRNLKRNKHLRKMFEQYERKSHYLDESDNLTFINQKENDQLMHDLLFDEET